MISKRANRSVGLDPIKLRSFPTNLPMPPTGPELTLAFDLRFQDLYELPGLERVDGHFLEHLRAAEADLHARLAAARAAPESLDCKAEAELLIAIAPHLDRFVPPLFAIESQWEDLVQAHQPPSPP